MKSIILIVSLFMTHIALSSVDKTQLTFEGTPLVVVAAPTKAQCEDDCLSYAKSLAAKKFTVLKSSRCSKSNTSIDDWGRGNEFACKISFIR